MNPNNTDRKPLMHRTSLIDRLEVAGRLEAADPLSSVATGDDAEALRSRVLAAARADAPAVSPPLRSRRIVPAMAVASTLAVAAVGAVALAPSDNHATIVRAGLPGPVSAFAAEIRNAPMLHVRSVDSGTVDFSGRFVAAEDPERTEAWYATDGSASRTSYLDQDGGVLAESVIRGSERWVFNTRQGLLQHDERARRDDNKRSLLLTLREGVDGSGLRLVGRTEVRGQDVYEVAYDQHAGDAYPDDHRAFIAVAGGALLRIDALRLPLPADPSPTTPRIERTEILAYGTGPVDASLLDPSPQFRDKLNDTPAQGTGPAAPALPVAP